MVAAGTVGRARLLSAARRRAARNLVVGTASLSVLVATGLATPTPAAAAPTVKYIVVPNSGAGVAVNPKTHTIYVSGAHAVSIVNGKTSKVTGSVAIPGTSAGAIAVDSKTDVVYVANTASATVSVINGKTKKLTHTIKVGHDPVSIACDIKRDRIYVANVKSNTVSVINGKSNKVLHTVKVSHHPDSVAVDPKTNTVYATFEGVLNSNGYTYHAGVAFISGQKGKVTKLVKPASEAGSAADGVAVDPSTGRVYVVFDYSYGAVLVLNGKSGKVLKTIAVGSDPDMIALNLAKHLMYIGSGGPVRVSYVKMKSGKVIGTYGVEQGQTGMAIDPALKKLYVSSNELYLSGNNTSGLEVLHGS